MLLPKAGKDTENYTAAYRPLCRLNTLNKLFGQLVAARKRSYMEDKCQMSDRQYGFRQGRSTVDAVKKVVGIARNEMGKRKGRGPRTLVTVDVKNGFNAVPWVHINEAMKKRRVPQYISGVIRNSQRQGHYI